MEKKNKKLHPNYITGFADGESCFTASICRNKKYKIEWCVIPAFMIHLHVRDIALLRQIQHFFGVGNISIGKDGSAIYSVKSVNDLINVIIPHFLKYPLITQKQADFLLFKSILDLMNHKKQLYADGLQEIVNIRATLNNGLSDNLKAAFPNTKPVNRPVVGFKGIPDPNWLVGFIEAEGCFYIKIQESKTCKTGAQVVISFQIAQHSSPYLGENGRSDHLLVKSLVDFLQCGLYNNNDFQEGMSIVIVTKFKDIEEKILSLFDKYPLQGAKSLDYADFKRVVEIMKDKGHLSASGLDQIRKIKSKMNRGRNHD